VYLVRIAMLSPLYESVPPRGYGGTERVVWWLTDELVRRGHDVTLFASGDSRTRATQVALIERALRLDGTPRLLDAFALHLAAAHTVRERAHQFDLVHSHIDYLAFPAFQGCHTPHVHTMHGRLDIDGLAAVHRAFPAPLVSISESQREPLPDAAWFATVPHGLPIEGYPVGAGDGGYAVFLGRISPEKRPDAAIAIARAAGVRLVIAAKVDPADRAYFEAVIEPLLAAGTGVEFIGEVGDREKAALLGGACALVNPVLWPEPFGLVMIEAMACGTPVLGRRCGAIPEVLVDGVTGVVADDDAALVTALGDVSRYSRAACRARVEEHFTVARMVDAYERVYQQLVASSPLISRPRSRPLPAAG
jgi:glycosyltransferase involved in cell wall biosynthesis